MNIRIAFLGDSLTEWGNWEQWFPQYSVYNLGIAGERTDEILKRLAPLKSIQPKVLFVMMGINDLGNGSSSETIIENWNKFFCFTFCELPNTKIVVQSLLPFNSKLFPSPNLSTKSILHINKVLEEMAKSRNASFIKLFKLFANENNELDDSLTNDGLHLNKTGYTIWRNEVANYLKLL